MSGNDRLITVLAIIMIIFFLSVGGFWYLVLGATAGWILDGYRRK
ncbi:MAG: hypothetical protein ACRC7S_16405 [Cetobacterium sp.]